MTEADELGRVLRVAPHLTLARRPDGGVAFLVGEREHYMLRGAEALAVLERIDGVRSVARLLDACAELPPERVLYVLGRLEAQGFVEPARGGDPARHAFEAGLGVRAPASAFAAGRAAAPEASVFAAGLAAAPEASAFTTGLAAAPEAPAVELADAAEAGGATRAMADALRAAGFELAASVGRGGTRVVVADDYLAPDCADLARETLRSGRACFLVKPTGLRPFIGPYFDGAEGQACPVCLADALREQRPVERVVQQDGERGRPAPPRASIGASVAAAANLAAIELRATLARPGRAAPPRLRALDFPRFELSEHLVRRRPQCPACGDATLQAAIGERPLRLSPAPVGFDADGGSRREPPAESYARLRHLVSPLLGPVTYLHPTPGRHAGSQPVFSSGYLVAPQRNVDAGRFDRHCAGKGCTEEQARMSALAEALERYSGTYRGDEACRFASFRELEGEAVHPDALQLFSAAQRAAGSAPPSLPPDARIAWTPAWSLGGRRRWVPLAYCYAEAPARTGAAYCAPSSNGSAAGNCLEEAVLQGLYEAVERDAVAVWWYGRLRRPEARAGAAPSAYLEERRRGYAALGWSMWALDLTHDVGLPVIVAVAVHEPSDRLALGFGAHHDAGLALRRAACELDQVFDPGGRIKSPWGELRASELDFLRPDPGAARVEPPGPRAGRDLKDLIEAWARRLEGLGLETLVVDKTRPDVGLAVAQVIVPGLRHPWPRFAPGRLYSVPVALGLWPRPPAEEELNPRPLLV
ncbi:MAG TPA: TOMM precursor leader peptide-binding protein [Polyangiaceae bacterium]|nr:TOMM precursor leader peptide-binding protein [Polyangiaceae bacterium]